MAQKKRKHGKVEVKQAKPFMRFQPGMLILLVLLSFAACFAIYLISATSQPDYWEREIAPKSQGGTADGTTIKNTAAVINPVPSSERADASRLQECIFIGDINELSVYCDLADSMIFTDSVPGMSESRMRSIARGIVSASPKAAYIWIKHPSDNQTALNSLTQMVNIIREQDSVLPLYVLTALPAEEASGTQEIDTWNSALFSLSDELGLHYVDICTMLEANDETLSPAYREEKVLYETVADQILTHVAD